MKVIISFCGLQERQKALQTQRPFALQPLAASTILGHILERLKELDVDKVTILVSGDLAALQAWTNEAFAGQNFEILVVNGKTPLDGLSHDLQFKDADPILFVSGEFVSEANYFALAEHEADVVCLIQEGSELIPSETFPIDQKGYFTGSWGKNEVMWAGCIWFRKASDLKAAIGQASFKANPYLNTLLASLDKQGLSTATLATQSCFGTGTPDRLLHANARLMQLGYCSEDAIERSYSEEFTVLPPVFFHETAVIENSVVGPFVNIEAGAVLRNAIVSNSFVGEGAQIIDAVVENSFIGDRGHLKGSRQTIILGDDARSIKTQTG